MENESRPRVEGVIGATYASTSEGHSRPFWGVQYVLPGTGEGQAEYMRGDMTEEETRKNMARRRTWRSGKEKRMPKLGR